MRKLTGAKRLGLAVTAALGTSMGFGTTPTQAAPLNAKQVTQFVNPLPNPLDPSLIWQPDVNTADEYTIEIQEFLQPLGLDKNGVPLPDALVWGYGKTGHAGTFLEVTNAEEKKT